MSKGIYKEYMLECDECGLTLFDKTGLLTYSPKERTQVARDNGWMVGKKDYCDKCKGDKK